MADEAGPERRPLCNRVGPDGEIVAVDARGLFMGNRGGRLHDPQSRTLGPARWRTRAWICCLTAFRGRRRAVMGQSYTELFFLDEVTALAAGHRPCFECRRADALAFRAAWAAAGLSQGPPSAADMDARLDRERRAGRAKRTTAARAGDLPGGAVVRIGERILALRAGRVLEWSFTGYTAAGSARDLPQEVEVLTPRCVLAVLAAGYRPRWHQSAGDGPA